MLSSVARGLHKFVRLMLMYAAFGVSLLPARRSQIVEEHPAGSSLAAAKRVAIFVHFDCYGRIHDFVLHYLNALRDAGFAIVFVSNAPKLEPDELRKIQTLCAKIVRRRNVGYDFGAFKDAITLIGDIGQLDELLLANDSVYGPFSHLADVLSRCDGSAAIWGITDNWDFRYHLQSYFLLLKRDALASHAVAAFWRRLRYVRNKDWIIRKYEVGFTQAMLRAGMRCRALFPYHQATAALLASVKDGSLNPETLSSSARQHLDRMLEAIDRGQPLNPTHFFWDYLIAAGCPFLKRDLLAENPMQLPHVSHWLNLIETTTKYDTDLILRHQQATFRHRAI